MNFNDKIYKLLLEQSKIEEYVNPHLLEGILSGLEDSGYFDRNVSREDRTHLIEYIDNMWSW